MVNTTKKGYMQQMKLKITISDSMAEKDEHVFDDVIHLEIKPPTPNINGYVSVNGNPVLTFVPGFKMEIEDITNK